jgi:hypothetical protein
VSVGTRDLIFLGAVLLFMAGFFYLYVAGVHYEDRALSRTSAVAILAAAVMAVVILVRILS